MLEKSSKIYVAGHHGLVGSAIWNNLLQRGYTSLVRRSHQELDLLEIYINHQAVYISLMKPVFNL